MIRNNLSDSSAHALINIFPYFVQFNNMAYDFSVSDLTIYQYAVSCEDLGKHYIISFTTI